MGQRATRGWLVGSGGDGAGEWFCVRRDADSAVLAWYFVEDEAHVVATGLVDFETRSVHGEGIST